MRRLALLLPLVLLLAAPADAGRLFDDAQPAFAYDLTPPAGLLDNTITMHVQFNADDGTLPMCMASVTDWNAATDYHKCIAAGDDSDHANAYSYDFPDPIGYAQSSASWTAGTWSSIQARINGTASRSVWLEGGNIASNTTVVDPDGLDTVGVGVAIVNPSAQFFSGTIGLVAFYDSALSDGEVGSLGAGAWPPYVASANLAIFMQMTGQRAKPQSVLEEKAWESLATARAGHKNLCPWPGMQQ